MKKVLSILLALTMALSLLPTGIVTLGCLPIALPVAAANTVKVVTVGDSITCGVVFPDLNTWSTTILPGNYPKLVVDKLNAQNDGKTYELTNLAISGSAVVGNDVIGTTDTATSWYNQSKSKICHADILTIMLGTNDAGNNWNTRKHSYKDIYKQIVADFRTKNPNLKLYVITSPNSFKAPYNENLANDVIPMQKELAEELGGTLIDVYRWSKLKMEKDGEGSFIDAIDITKGIRVHPGEDGHVMMADIVYAGITKTDLPTYITDLDKAPPEYTYTLNAASQATITTYGGKGGDVVIPNEIDGHTVVGFLDQTFIENKSITSLTIPNTIKTIPGLAFRGCTALTTVNLPDGLTTISQYAFRNCSALTAVNVPASVTSIGLGAFSNCPNLTVYGKADSYAEAYANENNIPFEKLATPATDFTYTITDGEVTIIGYTGTDSDVIIPSIIEEFPVTAIGDSAFANCTNLTKVTLPKNLNKIGSTAFYNCTALTAVNIPDSVNSIGHNAFYFCRSLTSITIPAGVTRIEADTFYYCDSLTDVTIGNGVTYIGYQTFEYCSNLTSVVIPDSVTTIDEQAFRACGKLTAVTIPNSVTTIGRNAFISCPSLTIHGKAGSYAETYANKNNIPFEELATPATDFTYTIADGEVTITGYKGADGDVVIPSKIDGCPVTAIGSPAFANCAALTSVTIPDSVTTIGHSAFYFCRNLTSVTIPAGVTRIEADTFYYCDSLTDVTIGDGVTYIGYEAFEYCSNLTSVVIPDGVTTIDEQAFRACGKLTAVTIPNSVTAIGRNAFISCDNLTIHSHVGSYAETYANENNIPFKAQVLSYEGAQISDNVNGDYAIRFGFSVNGYGIGWDKNYNTVIADDATVVIDGESYALLGFGANVALDYATADTLEGVDVPAAKLYSINEDGTVTYTVRVTNLTADGADHRNEPIYVKGYIRYLDHQGNECIYTMPVAVNCYNDVLGAVNL